jgi:hypothetical protein
MSNTPEIYIGHKLSATQRHLIPSILNQYWDSRGGHIFLDDGFRAAFPKWKPDQRWAWDQPDFEKEIETTGRTVLIAPDVFSGTVFRHCLSLNPPLRWWVVHEDNVLLNTLEEIGRGLSLLFHSRDFVIVDEGSAVWDKALEGASISDLCAYLEAAGEEHFRYIGAE